MRIDVALISNRTLTRTLQPAGVAPRPLRYRGGFCLRLPLPGHRFVLVTRLPSRTEVTLRGIEALLLDLQGTLRSAPQDFAKALDAAMRSRPRSQ